MCVLRIDGVGKVAGGELLCGRGEERVSYTNIDSQDVKEGMLFVPLVGEKVDVHRFLEPVIATGTRVVFTVEALAEAQHEAVAEAGTAVIRVADTLITLQALANWLRSRLSLPLIGVTDSVGKITTREMIAATLLAKYQVFETKANHSPQIGVPLTLFDIEDEEIGVIEVGISRPGEVHIISELVYPAVVVVTNIGVMHLMKLESRGNTRDGKLKVQDDMQEDALLFRNADDVTLFSGQIRDGITARTYDLVEDAGCRAENAGLVSGCAEFTTNIRGKRVAMKLDVSGEHQVLNALAAPGVVEAYGVPLAGVTAELRKFKGHRHRQQISERGGTLVVDDSYNTSPASMRAAFSILREMKNRHCIMVLDGMKELGEAEKKLHWEVDAGLVAAKGVECLYTLGGLAAEFTAAYRERYGTDHRPGLRCFSDRESLSTALKETVKPGDVLLFKASNSMRFSEFADYFPGQGRQGAH